MRLWDIWVWGAKCLFTSQLSVLINGSPTREFKVPRGIRQGDSLSPFLFHCASEVGLFKKAIIEMTPWCSYRPVCNLYLW